MAERGAAMKAYLKKIIVRLAVKGAIPPGLAMWLIQRGGLKHA